MTHQEADDAGTRFIRALAGRDGGALLDLLAKDVVLRALTPGRFWEATGSRRVLEDVHWRWFEPGDVVEQVLEVRTADVAGRARVDDLLRVRTSEAPHLVEQRAYLDLVEQGRAVRLEVVCGGFRRLPEDAGAPTGGA